MSDFETLRDEVASGHVNLIGLSSRIRACSPPDRLRLAAELLQARQPNAARVVVKEVLTGLDFVLGLGPATEPPTQPGCPLTEDGCRTDCDSSSACRDLR